MKLKIFFVILSTFVGNFLCSQSNQINVKDFGAKGNGVADDTYSFQKCVNKALTNSSSTIIIPDGKYLITKPIVVDVSKIDKLTIKGKSKGKSILIIKKPIVIFEFKGDKDNPVCNLDVEFLKFQGNNPPFSLKHKYYNTYTRGAAAYFYNTKSVIFSNNIISNIYGDGILVKNLNYKKCKLENRTKVTIENNLISNVWGQKNKNSKGSVYGHYGDGICFNNVYNSLVANNTIVNELSQTKQYGRAGIVVEYNCENITFSDNIIGGYESGIHLESDFGGHKIFNNTFKESENGLFCFMTKNAFHKDLPMIISGNKFSNLGIPKNLKLSRIRSKSERGLISIITRGDLRKNTLIENNTFTVDNNYQFNGNSIMQIHSNLVKLKNNKFSNLNFSSPSSSPVILLKGSVGLMENESLNKVNLKAESLSSKQKKGLKLIGSSKIE